MIIHRTTFEIVKHQAVKHVSCAAGCGKKLRRQRTFSMTLNPWNRNPDGTIRTVDDIRRALSAEAQNWKCTDESVVCKVCAGEVQP